MIPWTLYLLRQTAYAGTVLVVLFLLAELLAPGSVLPFLNLHAFVIGVLALHGIVIAIPSEDGRSPVARALVAMPIALALIAATWIALGDAGMSAALLALAVTVLIVSFAVAIMRSYAKH